MLNDLHVTSMNISPLYLNGIFSYSFELSKIVLQNISNLPVLLFGLHLPIIGEIKFNFSFNLTRYVDFF